MSAAKKKGPPSKVCRIFEWVRARDPLFASAIEQLCMVGALSPDHRTPGITFLYPADDAHRREIVEKADDDGDAAVAMINALVIPDYLPTSSDFQKNPVGSLNGTLYEVEKASGDTVALKGGVALARARDFALLQKDAEKKLAVWVVTAGRPPLAGGAFTRRFKAKGGAAAAVGGGARGGAASARRAFARAVEAEFAECLRRDGCVARDPFLAKVASLLNFLKEHHPETLQAVAPFIDWNPVISFYILLEPYKSAGEFLLPEALLFGDASGWNGVDNFADAKAQYEAFFGAPGADHAAVAGEADRVRQQLMGINNKLGLPKAVKAAYGQLEAANSIGGLAGVLPAAAAAHLRACPGKKLWQDELRFVAQPLVQEAYAAARASPSRFQPEDWAEVVQLFSAGRPGDNYQAEAGMTELVEAKGNVAPTADFSMLQKFVNSTDFLYTPAPQGMIGGYMGAADDPTDAEPYNRNYEAHRSLGRTRTHNEHGVSRQALAELRLYAAKHGSLDGLLR